MVVGVEDRSGPRAGLGGSPSRNPWNAAQTSSAGPHLFRSANPLPTSAWAKHTPTPTPRLERGPDQHQSGESAPATARAPQKSGV